MAFVTDSAAASAAIVLISLCGLAYGTRPAASQDQMTSQTGAIAPRPAQPAVPATVAYYVEFRAADIGVYGHSYIAYGRLGANGRPVSAQYSDFHPEGGNLGLVAGHVLPVAGDMTPEKATMTLPLTTVFRRKLTATEYNKLIAAIKVAHANTHVWNALAYNCNSFVADVAQAIGLKTPPTILFASAFIPALRDLNETPTPTARRGSARTNETTERAMLKRTQRAAPSRQPST